MQPPDVHPADNTGNGHESEQRRDDEEQEIVPRVNGGKTDKQGEDNVETTCLGYGQASGTEIVLRIEANSSSLSMLSCSALQTRRWEQTGIDTSFTSSGMT